MGLTAGKSYRWWGSRDRAYLTWGKAPYLLAHLWYLLSYISLVELTKLKSGRVKTDSDSKKIKKNTHQRC